MNHAFPGRGGRTARSAEVRTRRRPGPSAFAAGDPTDITAALASMNADDLREVIRTLLLELSDRAHASAVSAIVERAARSGSGFAPAAVGEGDVLAAVAFSAAARRASPADPVAMDAHLQRGSAAFLRGDHRVAHRILGALLPPLADGEIDLGWHELPDEVLGTDLAASAARYVVSAYLLAEPGQRAAAVRAAIEEVRGLGRFQQPLREIERAAARPLPEFPAFLAAWRTLVEEEARSPGDPDRESWRREVVQRLDGAAGLGRLARSTRRADDLRAWCRSLVAAGDAKAALRAHDEAAKLAREAHVRGELLDGAVLAARALNRRDLAARLGRAWRVAPTLLRLRRWLGSAAKPAQLRRLAAAALADCPERAHRQRALLHLLLGEHREAAKLLAAAPGLGWSGPEHPGHLLFATVPALLGSTAISLEPGADLDELLGEPSEPSDAPDARTLLARAGVTGIAVGDRPVVVAALRTAAERRLSGVTGEGRRGHYRHAATLVAVCAAVDASATSSGWVAEIRDAHRRFPALRAELDQALGV